MGQKYIEIERAKRLENSIMVFTCNKSQEIYEDLKDFKLTNGTASETHPRSDEFVKAYKDYHAALKVMRDILEIND